MRSGCGQELVLLSRQIVDGKIAREQLDGRGGAQDRTGSELMPLAIQDPNPGHEQDQKERELALVQVPVERVAEAENGQDRQGFAWVSPNELNTISRLKAKAASENRFQARTASRNGRCPAAMPISTEVGGWALRAIRGPGTKPSPDRVAGWSHARCRPACRSGRLAEAQSWK